jgi:hypothetical protein
VYATSSDHLSAAADDSQFQTWVGAFLQALALLGWTIGRNVRIETRWMAVSLIIAFVLLRVTHLIGSSQGAACSDPSSPSLLVSRGWDVRQRRQDMPAFVAMKSQAKPRQCPFFWLFGRRSVSPGGG